MAPPRLTSWGPRAVDLSPGLRAAVREGDSVIDVWCGRSTDQTRAGAGEPGAWTGPGRPRIRTRSLQDGRLLSRVVLGEAGTADKTTRARHVGSRSPSTVTRTLPAAGPSTTIAAVGGHICPSPLPPQTAPATSCPKGTLLCSSPSTRRITETGGGLFTKTINIQ